MGISFGLNIVYFQRGKLDWTSKDAFNILSLYTEKFTETQEARYQMWKFPLTREARLLDVEIFPLTREARLLDVEFFPLTREARLLNVEISFDKRSQIIRCGNFHLQEK